MKKKEISRILVLLGLLFAATLLLLALPQKIFEKLDTDLLKESGGAVYELQAVESDMLLFAEKLKLFVDGEPINRIVWGETFPADKLILEEMKNNITSFTFQLSFQYISFVFFLNSINETF